MLNNNANQRQNRLIEKSNIGGRIFSIALIALFIFQFSAISQNIDTKIGTGGQYIIRTATDTFMTVSENTGYVEVNHNLALPAVTDNSTIGTIYKGSNRFIHTYQLPSTDGRNLFMGINSGNFTMSSSGVNYYASNNTAVGYFTLTSLTTGGGNSAFGCLSLQTNMSGYNNSAFGYFSLEFNTSGYYNSAFGTSALLSNGTGYENSAFGALALSNNTSGYYNSAFGRFSLSQCTTGHNNSTFGYRAGYNITTGSNLTCIGANAQPSSATATNEITLGDSTVTTLRCHVTSITALSDARDKKNIQDLNLGIDFLMKIRPRLFNWDRREWYGNNKADGSKMEKTPTAGFIAQELDEVQTVEQAEWLKLVMKNNPDRLEATPGNLLPIIVKAVQDLKKENENKDQQIANLKNKLTQFEQVQKLLVSKIEKLESASNKVKEVNMSINK
jgi:hypothetical protein